MAGGSLFKGACLHSWSKSVVPMLFPVVHTNVLGFLHFMCYCPACESSGLHLLSSRVITQVLRCTGTSSLQVSANLSKGVASENVYWVHVRWELLVIHPKVYIRISGWLLTLKWLKPLSWSWLKPLSKDFCRKKRKVLFSRETFIFQNLKNAVHEIEHIQCFLKKIKNYHFY